MNDFLYISWNLDPNLYEGLVTIRYYSLLFGISFFLGYYLMKKMLSHEKSPEEWLDKILIYTVIATVIGARLGHVLFYDPTYYFNNPIDIFKIWEGGLASHGAAIAIIIALWIFSKKVTKKSVLWSLDKVVVTVAIAACFIRVGNLMNSEIIGTKSSADTAFFFQYNAERSIAGNFRVDNNDVEVTPLDGYKVVNTFKYPLAKLSVTFPKKINNNATTISQSFYLNNGSNYKIAENHFFALSPDESNALIKGNVFTTTIAIIPRIPTQLIEAGCYLVIFLILFWGYWKRNWHKLPGLLFGTFLSLLFGARFVVEFWKEHQTLSGESSINMGQWLSIPAVLLGLFFIIRALKLYNHQSNEIE